MRRRKERKIESETEKGTGSCVMESPGDRQEQRKPLDSKQRLVEQTWAQPGEKVKREKEKIGECKRKEKRKDG